jgi:hypothetical protein
MVCVFIVFIPYLMLLTLWNRQFVDHFPDFKVQIVDHFPDIKVQYVFENSLASFDTTNACPQVCRPLPWTLLAWVKLKFTTCDANMNNGLESTNRERVTAMKMLRWCEGKVEGIA